MFYNDDMKIQQNQNELTITSSALVGRIVGGAIALAGIGVIGATAMGAIAEQLYGYGGGAALIVGGAVTIALCSSKVVRLVKGGNSSITTKRLIGAAKTQQFDASALSSVQLRTQTKETRSVSGDNNTSNSISRESVLQLIMNDNATIEIGRSNGGAQMGMLIKKAPLHDEAQQIADFLGVQLQAVNSDASLVDIAVAVKDAFGATKPTPQPIAAVNQPPPLSPPVATPLAQAAPQTIAPQPAATTATQPSQAAAVSVPPAQYSQPAVPPPQPSQVPPRPPVA